MEREEDTTEKCADCGALVNPGLDRAFAFSEDSLLCYECASRRGGSYDEIEDRWVVVPDVSDEPDERRPHP